MNLISGAIPNVLGPPVLECRDERETKIQLADAIYASQIVPSDLQAREFPEPGHRCSLAIDTPKGTIIYDAELLAIGMTEERCECHRVLVLKVSDPSTYRLLPRV